MFKKTFKDGLFPYLNWILRKTSPEPESNIPSIFIINRWLSMVDKDFAQIVNMTFNRWVYKSLISKDNSLAGKFYKIIMPKHSKKINYIKKENSTDKEENTEIDLYSNLLEMSQREVRLYNSTLEFLNKNLK